MIELGFWFAFLAAGLAAFAFDYRDDYYCNGVRI